MTQQAGVSAERVVRTCLHCKNAPVQLGRAYCDNCFHELLNGDCAAPGCKHEKSALATAPPEQAALEQGFDLGLERAAMYVSQHDNLGDIAADEIRALKLRPAQPQAISAGALSAEVAELLKRVDEDAAGTRCLTMAEVTLCLKALKLLAELTERKAAAHDQKVRAEVLETAAKLLSGTRTDDGTERDEALCWAASHIRLFAETRK